MYELLGIDINMLDHGIFYFYQTGLIRKVLEYIGMDHCNGLPTPTKVQVPLGTDKNVSEAKRDFPNSYASVIGMMLYLASNTRPDISFAVNRCARFTHNSKASHETAVKRICRYLQGTKDNGLVLIHPRNWWWIVMLMKILQDCGDMKILKTLFALGVELDLW